MHGPQSQEGHGGSQEGQQREQDASDQGHEQGELVHCFREEDNQNDDGGAKENALPINPWRESQWDVQSVI